MSHVIVAVGRLTEPTDERARALAEALGMTVYDARQRLQPPAPRVVAIYLDPAEASARITTLHEAGFQPLRINGDTPGYGVPRIVVQSFELLPDRVRIEDRAGATREVRNEDIQLLVAGIATSIHREKRQETTRAFDLGKAVMSGGLAITKKKKVRETRVSEQTRAFLEVRAAGHPPLSFWEDELQYQGLGAAMQPSRLVNHRRLVQALRHRAPQAPFDDRLTNAAGRAHLLGGALTPQQHIHVALDLLAAYYAAQDTPG